MINKWLELVMNQLTERMIAMLRNLNKGNSVQCNNNHRANSDVEAGAVEEEDVYDEEFPRRRCRAVVEED